MRRRSFRRDCSGQVLIVSALLVALLLLSTAIYVIEIGKSVPTVDSDVSASYDCYKSSVRSTLISALANASAGGDADVLASDLAELKTVILEHSYQALLTLDYSTLNDSSYDNGIWISWGSSGEGVSGAYASFVFSSSSYSGASDVEYALNVTSRVHVSGRYVQLNDTVKQVSLSVDVLNEAGPALAQEFTFRYQNASDWVLVDAPSVVDYGDGTYAVSFYAETGQINESLGVSTLCLDKRGISVCANVTCNAT